MRSGGIKYPEVMALLGYFVLGTLAAYGLFSAIWALFGWLLPKGNGCAICCFGMPDEGILWRYRWMTGMGIWRLPLLVVGEGPEGPEMEICGREELLSRLERERNQLHGTGNGDHTGCHQRGGVPEL